MMSTQIMFNGLLTVLEAPSRVLFDPNRPTQSIANALDFLFHKYMHMKMSTIDHVRPVVAHIQHLMKLAREQDFLRQIDTPEFREKMTDIINLEVSIRTIFLEHTLNVNLMKILMPLSFCR